MENTAQEIKIKDFRLFQIKKKKRKTMRTVIDSGIVKKVEFIKIELLWKELPVHPG